MFLDAGRRKRTSLKVPRYLQRRLNDGDLFSIEGGVANAGFTYNDVGVALGCSRESNGLLWDGREVGALLRIRGALGGLGGRGTAGVLVDGLLGLVGILAGVRLDGLGGLGRLLGSEVTDLVSLLGGHGIAALKLGVDDILVLDVDEGTHVGDGGSDEGEAPEGHKLDEPVGEDGSKESLSVLIRTTSGE